MCTITNMILSLVPTFVYGKENAKALVDATYSGTPGAVVDSVKRYKTLQAAIDDVPANNGSSYIIAMKNGRYYEKVSVNKPWITLIGEDREKTVCTFDLAQGSKKADGTPWGNMCATVLITSPHFRAENITFENGFDYTTNFLKPTMDSTRINDCQAIAVRTAKGSEQALFVNCIISGYQDPLFADYGTQYYKKCLIRGHVDFIYGGGKVVFTDCDIVTRNRPADPVGYITAPCTQKTDEFGLVFFSCRLKRETTDIPKGSVFLGRPWHPTRQLADGSRAADPDAIGKTIYINCYMDDHISPQGWDKMSGKDKTGNKIWFYPDKDARFFEYGSTGPGAIKSDSRKLLSQEEANKITPILVLGGWDPEKELK